MTYLNEVTSMNENNDGERRISRNATGSVHIKSQTIFTSSCIRASIRRKFTVLRTSRTQLGRPNPNGELPFQENFRGEHATYMNVVLKGSGAKGGEKRKLPGKVEM